MNPQADNEIYRVGWAEFVKSAAKTGQFPSADRPEVAFAGRSNVGKSSLLNKLLNRRKLARTGSTPGRTQLINFFNVDDRMYFVDLPGFGYAKVPLAVRAAWQPMVEGYLSDERDIRLVTVLVDIRREPGVEEIRLLDWLDANELPAIVIATKVDKIKRGQRAARLAAIRKALRMQGDPIPFSSVTGEGRELIWGVLSDACDLNPVFKIDPE